MFAVAQYAVYSAVLLLLAVPLGRYIARVYQGDALLTAKVLGPLERGIYRLAGIRADEEMSWKRYAACLLAFNLAGALLLYVFQRIQGYLPMNPAHLGAVGPGVAFNTAVSFASNTNWQAYSGETTMSHLTQMAGLTVQNFLSAATGMAVAVVLARGFARKSVATLGSFWVDLTRGTLYVLLPLSLLLAGLLASQGVVFGGVGSGLYGLLMFAIIAVFIAGLMVGRTPEFLGKKLEAYEMKMAALVVLLPSAAVLVGTAVACLLPTATGAAPNPGPHGFSEILYAFSSAANNNGSAFAGLDASGSFYTVALGLCMLIGRYWVIVPVLAVAGSLAGKKSVPPSAGTLPTDTPMFVLLLCGTVVLVGALTFIPALALGPIVEHLRLAAAAVTP